MESTERRTALIVVDLQADFLPGGSLPVAEADRIVRPIADLVASSEFTAIVATQDWHPAGHVSFASRHAGREPFDEIELHGHPQVLWPDHCVQGTPGAELAGGVPWHRVSAVLRKGTDREVDSYSGFRNNWNASGERPSTGLAGYLRDLRIEEVTLCGLAREICVKWTAEDAADAGFRVMLLWNLTRAVDTGTDEATLRDLREAGVEIVRP